jgi:hypothetical protein
MKLTKTLYLTPIFIAGVLLAQGPPGGGGRQFGPRGFQGGPGGFGGRSAGILGAGPGSRTPVTGEPYSATETLQRQQTLANGNQIATKEQSNVYRDSQGRIRTEETVTPPASSGSAPYMTVTIFDPVAGYRYVLNSANMTAFQSPLPKPRPARGGATSNRQPPPPGPNQAQTANLGTQSINGVSAAGTQLTETIPVGAIGNAQPIQVTRTSWISTDLKVPVQIRTSDPRYGTTDMELTNIVQAEPSASLFVVPAGYTIQQGGGPGGPRGAGRRGPGPR